MFSESEIDNFKKNFLDELGCYNEAEKVFDEMAEKAKNLYFSVMALISPEMQDFSEASALIWEKLEIPPEMLAFFKDNFDFDPALLPEEHFKNGLRIGQEFFLIEKKQH